MYFNSAVEMETDSTKTSTVQTTYGTKRPRQRPYHCVLLTSAAISVSQLHAEFSENYHKRQRTTNGAFVEPLLP